MVMTASRFTEECAARECPRRPTRHVFVHRTTGGVNIIQSWWCCDQHQADTVTAAARGTDRLLVEVEEIRR